MTSNELVVSNLRHATRNPGTLPDVHGPAGNQRH